MFGVVSSKRPLNFDEYQDDIPNKRGQNFFVEGPYSQNSKSDLKRCPDFHRPQLKAKYLKSTTDFSRPVREIKGRDYSNSLKISQEIINSVSEAQLLNACNTENTDEALQALFNITSFNGLNIRTSLQVASMRGMSAVADAIKRRARYYFYDANLRYDFTTIATIKGQFDLNDLLIDCPNETTELCKRINNIIFGTQLLDACKNGHNEEALEALSKITSYDALLVEDERRRTAYLYATGIVESKITNKIFNFSLLR